MYSVKEPQYKIILETTDCLVYDLIPESIYDINSYQDKKIIDKIRVLQNNDNSKLSPTILSFGFPIDAILFGGSRLLNLNSFDSDYDLNVILNENDFRILDTLIADISIPLRYIEYKGKTIH